MCYICGRGGPLERHHIFGGNPNRGHSEHYGLTVHLCPYCHRDGKEGVHADPDIMEALHKIGQAAFEKANSRQEFIKVFGKNYLDNIPEAKNKEDTEGIIWLTDVDI